MDKVRIYMPFRIAQEYFDRDKLADEIEVLVNQPDQIEKIVEELSSAIDEKFLFWTYLLKLIHHNLNHLFSLNLN